MGYVRSIREVAGFVPHQFRDKIADLAYSDLGTVDRAQPPRRVNHVTWRFARLELVSLLKHETPRVYMSEHLPRMQDLDRVTTRALDSFETRALPRLDQGEELITASSPNCIVMLGAIRAGETCLRCHQVERGTLLGAFTYELRRDPAIALDAIPLTTN